MKTWILILTLTSHGNGGQAVTHIPGFSSKGTCEDAAQAWLATAVHSHSPVRPAAVCVIQ